MDNKRFIFGSMIAITFLVSLSFSSSSFAQDSNSVTSIIPIDTTIGIEKTIISMNIPENNSLPWAFVEGKIANHVDGHPVIIQIFDDNGQTVEGNNIGAIHFAQIDVNDDGTYEYKFRVKDVSGDQTINIFSGDYTVKVFKVVYLTSTSNLV